MKKPPGRDEVALVRVYPASDGIRYTCLDTEGKVVFDSPRTFRSRRLARAEAERRWPTARVTFEVT